MVYIFIFISASLRKLLQCFVGILSLSRLQRENVTKYKVTVSLVSASFFSPRHICTKKKTKKLGFENQIKQRPKYQFLFLMSLNFSVFAHAREGYLRFLQRLLCVPLNLFKF